MSTRRTATLSLVAGLAIAAFAGCGSDEPETGTDAFCEQVAPLANLGRQLESPEADLDRLSGDVNNLVTVSPIAVRPSVETIAGALATMVSAAEASGEEGSAALAAGFAAIEGERGALERASEVVESYTERECGIDLTPDATDSTTAPEASPSGEGSDSSLPAEPSGNP